MDKESSEGDNRGDSIIGDLSSLFEEEHTEPLGGLSSPSAGTATAKKPCEVWELEEAPERYRRKGTPWLISERHQSLAHKHNHRSQKHYKI